MAEQDSPKISDSIDLDVEITKILESGALFRSLRYPRSIHDFPTTTKPNASLPLLISRQCEKCKISTYWECMNNTFDTSVPYQVKTYKCRNCESSYVRFALLWGKSKEDMMFQKFGEHPKPEIGIPKELSNQLGASDSSLYRRALISANISHGVAAVAYARRVVENKVDTLLDLIVEASRLSNEANSKLGFLEEVRASHQVDRKIELASQLLPSHLRPGGHNPLATLYTKLSDALHTKTDAECLAVFEEFRFVFEYLFRNLSTENAEAAAFAKRFSAKVSKPQVRKPKTTKL